MRGEVWRVVPSLPKLLVSSEGRVMTIPTLGTMPHGGDKYYGGVPYFGVWSKRDARFIISVDGHTYKIARLVCEAFHGRCPALDGVAMHLDENSANNRADNLRWGSQKENLNAPGFLEYCRSRTGDNSPTTKHRKKSAA